MSRRPPVLHTYVAPTCFVRMSRDLSRLFRAVLKKEMRNPRSFKKGLVARACRKGLSRRLVADCLSQAERLCYKPYVAERRPGASYIPGLLSRAHICIYIYIWRSNSREKAPCDFKSQSVAGICQSGAGHLHPGLETASTNLSSPGDFTCSKCS